MDTKDWLVNWFHKTSAIEVEIINESVDLSFFECGFVDSFGFINLLSDIEEQFGVTFSNDDFLDRSFSTINGLESMINKKK